MEKIYLDNNATTAIDPAVADEMLRVQLESVGNPASQHWAGRHCRQLVETARDEIAAAVGARSARVLFTSGGTESNNLALHGLAGTEPGEVLISPVEHPSVSESARALSRSGHSVRELAVDSRGVVDPATLEAELSSTTRLVSIMLANNETGVLQPIRELAKICSAAKVPFHTDAVQAAGKISLDFEDLGVDALSISAHKFHGPIGIGALVVRPDIQLEPTLRGGFQQGGLRAGTESVASIVGLRAALKRSVDMTSSLAKLRDALEASLCESEAQITVLGQGASRVPQTSCLAFPGADRQEMMMALDLAGVACSTGSACASGSSEPSHVLRAMGLPASQIESALRFSVSRFTTPSEIEQAADRILLAYRRLRRPSESQKWPVPTRKSGSKAI